MRCILGHRRLGLVEVVMRQLSGSPHRQYSLRFNTAAEGLEKALELLGCQVYDDGTGMAYIVAKNNQRIGGPASCQEMAMWDAVRHLERNRNQP